jgi:hypothetical protein
MTDALSAAIESILRTDDLSEEIHQAQINTLRDAYDAAKKDIPRREWRGLTEEEIHDCFQQRHRDKAVERRMITRAIEAALKEKNHD